MVSANFIGPMRYEVDRSSIRPYPHVLVTGGTWFDDADKIAQALATLLEKRGISILAHSGRFGAERLAGQWALHMGLPTMVFIAPDRDDPPHWIGACKVDPADNLLFQTRATHVIAFPGDELTERIEQRAREQKLPVWRPYPSIRAPRP
ncbi:SLOG family protein [Comamonadaceae bacterium PP-2]